MRGTLELEDGTKLKDHHDIVRKKICKRRSKAFCDKELIKRQLRGK